MTRQRLRVRENPAASEAMRAKTYWHGSPRTEAAESILREGLRPPPSASRGHTAPRGGHVYLTPHLSYAIIYAVGGHLSCGGSPEAIAALIQRHGRYGYLFEVAGQALSRVEPDEDSVGEAVSEAMDMERGHLYRSEEAIRVALQDDPTFARAFLAFARKAMTPRQLDGIRVGFSAAESSGGKRALRTMPDWIKMRLLTMGAHVAHHGSLPTRSAWRFDRSKMPFLRMDGANFFDLAERLDRPSPRDNPARGATYAPDFSAPAEGMWVRDPGPAWVQHHRALVTAALRSWSGSPAEMKLHLDDVGAGAPVPGNGTGKMMRAQPSTVEISLDYDLRALAGKAARPNPGGAGRKICLPVRGFAESSLIGLAEVADDDGIELDARDLLLVKSFSKGRLCFRPEQRDDIGFALHDLANAEDAMAEEMTRRRNSESARFARAARDGLTGLAQKVWRA